ncbi:MAG: tRNA pseudouridine(38-40) synthase TruA [Clostridia bacterium]|nr:tRNA pseudouridine(38-40) synthase TruA [Clostridia bacterium]
MRNIRLVIEYDGKEFKGWQKQPDRLNIQGEIEKAIETITREKVELIGSGRTDAGVNALGQVANFKTNSELPIEKFPYAINSLIKKSIRIKSAEEVEENFHSRYTCKRKTYQYTIDNSEHGTAIYRNMRYHFPIKLDEDKMNEAVQFLIGTYDFKSFKASGTSSKSSVRTIYDAKVWRENDLIKIELTGNGFLYNMIRIIAGTLVEVGEGKIDATDVKRILEAQDRNMAGKTLPACGLCLMSVEY